ncbi:uncharacterized protein LOC113859142 [Abrus precatorius]|uniref:Uncharacterized protein LOC113859142 n=1 Tax=Abrus precatorius TaxID=3816 RepID=A0A8B8KZE9_ABRPR|nr:uncharacterized protein LOC113859142 [Abrus precatorius]
MRRETETDNITRVRSEPGPDSLYSCVTLLTRRAFSACHEMATRVPRSDPNIALQLDQILAIADVLSAAEHRHGIGHHRDWYSILQLRPDDAAANRDLARQRFKTLVRLLDPNKNKFPLADDALMRVREAWFVLSDSARKDRFDREIREAATSFWTMCPYCWYLHQYERKYEDCTLRCANCRRTFHGEAVRPPPPETVVEGKEQYYCYHVSFPLRYPVDEERLRFGSDYEDKGNGVNDNALSGGRKRLRIKTVANRVRMKGYVDGNSDSDLDADEKDGNDFGT